MDISAVKDRVSKDMFDKMETSKPLKKHKVYRHGEASEKYPKGRNKLEPCGEPNSSADLVEPGGVIKQRRYYGPDGKPLVDIDFKHVGEHHEFPHKHVFIDGVRSAHNYE